MPVISFSQVSVRKYDTTVLHDLNWEVLPGQQWAIIGGTGSGKTTLLDTLAGKWHKASGTLTRTGIIESVANDYSFNRIVRSAAQYYQQRFHSQDAEIAPTVREVLLDQLKPIGTVDSQSVTLKAITVSEERLNEISGLLSLNSLLDKPFVTLSNGETRRMLLAVSLLKTPDILLLDFPFVGLDVHSREVLTRAMETLSKQGVSIILATRVTEIPDFITHVLELDKGKIAFQGKKNEVRKHDNPNIAALENTSQAGHRLGDPQLADFEVAFDLRNIRVVYNQQAVLDGITWKVKKGENWALSGPNGSGKSTLLSILTADHPQRFANDYDIFDGWRGGKNRSIWDIKKRIGHVSPELHLYFPTNTSVFKTIASGFFDATGVYFKKLTQEQIEIVHQTADILEVTHLLNSELRKLSKGEQRLVLLARALVKNPPLLILDEPCQGLDIPSTEHFKSFVDSICSNPLRTLVYVSHYVNEIPACVTQYIRLESGRVADDNK